MTIIKDGARLIHVKAPNYVNEVVDQFVALGYGAGQESKVALTFGKDILDVTHEVFRPQGDGVSFQTVVDGDCHELQRIDYATMVLSIHAAIRLRDTLNEVIAANPFIEQI